MADKAKRHTDELQTLWCSIGLGTKDETAWGLFFKGEREAGCFSASVLEHHITREKLGFCGQEEVTLAVSNMTTSHRLPMTTLQKLNAEKPLGSLNDGHSTLADLLIYCRKCCAQIYSPPIGGKHDSFIPGWAFGPNSVAAGCSTAVAVAFGLKLVTCNSCLDFGRVW